MKRLLLVTLLLLTACKRDPSGLGSAEAEALDYVKIVQIALTNAYADSGQKPIPATLCTDPLFGMKATSKNLTLTRCTARMDDPTNPQVSAVFNDNLAVLGDAQGVRKVQVSELPELK